MPRHRPLVAFGCASALLGASVSGTCAQETPHKLVGVTIVGERRVALFKDARPGSGGARFLPLGATVAGYRLVDIPDDHVTLEGSDGERTILRLGAGAAVGPPPSTAQQRASEIERTRAEIGRAHV